MAVLRPEVREAEGLFISCRLPMADGHLAHFTASPAPAAARTWAIRQPDDGTHPATCMAQRPRKAFTVTGAVFELSPHPDGSWTDTDLYDFTGEADGKYPAGGVVFDSSGNLYSKHTRAEPMATVQSGRSRRKPTS